MAHIVIVFVHIYILHQISVYVECAKDVQNKKLNKVMYKYIITWVYNNNMWMYVCVHIGHRHKTHVKYIHCTMLVRQKDPMIKLKYNNILRSIQQKP